MSIRVEKILLSLQVGVDDIRLIGTKGMGGDGKTTLARAVFDHISTQFEGKSFVENVRGFDLPKLQKQILSSVFNDQSIVVNGVSDGKILMKRMMPHRKTLVVLDDVDDIEQLEALVGDPTCFKPGSRIIFTSRDEQVLVGYGVERDHIHDVSLLLDEEAINLLSRYAFGRESPDQGYEDLTQKVVSYAAGLPLTIKLLGSFLRGRPKSEWEDTIAKLKTIPRKDTLKRLEISYEGLDEDCKLIFLHVACLLRDRSERDAIRILKDCGFHAKIGLKVLEQKSKLTIGPSKHFCIDKAVALHDRIEEMGVDIVRRLHPDEPNKHIILWKKEEIENILVNELGTKAILSIKLHDTDLHSATILQGLRKIMNLRFLWIIERPKIYTYETNVAHGSLPTTLRVLWWWFYPFWYLPKIFQPDNLVHLRIQNSNIRQLWEPKKRKIRRFFGLCGTNLKISNPGMITNIEGEEEKKILPKLRYLNIGLSKLKTLDLRMTPKLEELILKHCRGFKELKMEIECQCLNVLNLYGCSAFKELQMHVEYRNLKSLNLGSTGITNLNLEHTPNLERLTLLRCEHFVELHVPHECPKLVNLYLSGFKVSDFKPGLAPVLEKLESLRRLQLSFEDIECLPDSICMLKHLEHLDLRFCSHLKWLPEDLDRLECLTHLSLRFCSSLQDIPNSICNLKYLKELDLYNCKSLRKRFSIERS